MEKDEGRRRREKAIEGEILLKVGDVVAATKEAKTVDEVICALHSLAVLFFPLDSSLISGCLDRRFRCQVIQTNVPTPDEREEWWHVFYHGPAFPTLSRILLYNVASNWLPCFPVSARTHIYDAFFVKGPVSETVQAVIPSLIQNGTSEEYDSDAVCSNAERLLILCLLDHAGIQSMVKEFGGSIKCQKYCNELFFGYNSTSISRMAQLIASIPDKARPKAPRLLSSYLFFKQIIVQLLAGAQERSLEVHNKEDVLKNNKNDSALIFVGETFAHICRRGFTDILLSEIVPSILRQVRFCLSSNPVSLGPNDTVSKFEDQFWSRIIEAIRDAYTIERLSEGLLRQLAAEDVNDSEAYWILWMLYHPTIHQNSVRGMFIDKFLLWKVFPVCCLRWIFQFSVFKCPPPFCGTLAKSQDTSVLMETVKRLLGVWSKREFVRSTTLEQQAYITAAVGLLVEKLSKEELEKTKDALHSILQGVSCRLESPDHLIRKMGSCVALVFSKVIDPKNPLYLDETCKEDNVDWEFGLTTLKRRISATSQIDEAAKSTSIAENEIQPASSQSRSKDVKSKIEKEMAEFRLIDPDEVIDPFTPNDEHVSDEEEEDESTSDTSSDTSLLPYDLTDDDADLKGKVSQLSDIISALQKTDDRDGAENALDAAEKLIRTSPSELCHLAGVLAKALIHVRCSDITMEGEEESAEAKRQSALIALLVTCPFETVDPLLKLFYSSHVDVSQRVLILDVMTDAAQELSSFKVPKVKYKNRELILPTSGSQPWFIPSVRGPTGAGPWKELSEAGSILSFTHRYERDLPSKQGHTKSGKSRRWSFHSARVEENQMEYSKNKFPLYGAAFMLPAMQGFDKKRHGLDLLGQDFIVLGKLIYMLGVCMKCMAMHPEASVLAPALLDMISSREVSHHAEAYVRKSVLFAASCILVALHPSFVASSLLEGNQDVSRGLEWIRTWSLHVTEADPDTECSTMAMKCLQLHAEMALQASRSLNSGDGFRGKGIEATPSLLKRSIIMPFSISQFFG